MAEVVIASFPLDSWAADVRDLVQVQGIPAAVDYRGPRAWQVLVDEADAAAAGMVVASVAYLDCAVTVEG